MARTTRHSASKAQAQPPSSPPPHALSKPQKKAPAQPEPPEQDGLQKLKFSEPLSWRAGRAIPVADLLKRLEALANELRQYEQEELDISSLSGVARELASGRLLAHRDKGVRAWTACCLVDVLRLCAPNAPFTGSELKDIFTAIITSIIPALADPSNAYNEQHVYVLSSLAEVKSIVLLTDLDNADSLILSLFSSCFDIVSGTTKSSTGVELAKKVEYDMIRLLVPVIDEAPTLSPEVVDVIVAQFLRVDPRVLGIDTANTNQKSGKKKGALGGIGAVPVDAKQKTLLPKEYPPAYNMAKAVCSACPEKMMSYVSQYFNNVILDASGPAKVVAGKKGGAATFPGDSDDDTTEDIQELSKAHRLIRELWRACPDILQNVIPQIEAELSAESVSLRLLATQTIGDLASGIGVAGPPPPPVMDPAAWPQARIGTAGATTNTGARGSRSATAAGLVEDNILLTPLSPKPFSQVHAATYASFLSRRQDRSASVRAAWTTAVGRILLTSAGGVGLSNAEENELVQGLARMLSDADENVRIAGVEVVGSAGLDDVVRKIGGEGRGIGDADSVLAVLAERVKDRKQSVREVAMQVLGRVWGVAAGEIEAGNEVVIKLLGDVPSRILDAWYTNNFEIQVLIDRAMFELLLPLGYPPIKSKGKKDDEGKEKDKAKNEANADAIRVRRILTLAKNLDDRAKKVFFAFQSRQLSLRKFVQFFITSCEEYNGGVMDENEVATKEKLTRIITALSKTLPDAAKASSDLWKFATMHDRRNYHLIRFTMEFDSDYKTVVRAIRELVKRVQSNPAAPAGMLDTLVPLVYRSASLLYNRSHVPPIMEISRTDELGLGGIAHEMLKELSTQNPEVLEAHVTDICKDIEVAAPDENSQLGSIRDGKTSGHDVEQLLKACAGFAKKLPAKIPRDRKFMVALTKYALYSPVPKAAKHAVSVLMLASDKKEMYARDLIKKSVDGWTFGEKGYMTRLATISQINLLAPDQADEEADAILNIATEEVLLKNRSADQEKDGETQKNTEYKWGNEVDDETLAKEWALRILVNRVRSKGSSSDEEGFTNYAKPVFKVLNTLVEKYGELTKPENTPATQKSRLRLLAANLILKLCGAKVICDRMFDAKDFNRVALVAQDPLFAVRNGFVSQLKKRLTHGSHLGARWYTITFLLAFEPDINLKESTLTWLRSRTVFYARRPQAESQIVMESLASRLISLLAYHPDYPEETLSEDERTDDLADFARYILFYLSAVSNENNLSLIFHIFQRVKQVRDAVTDSDSISKRLYTLSDLAQATTRRFADIYSQQHKIGGVGGQSVNILQTYPGKMRLPSSLFANLASHSLAQSIAENNYLPEDVDDRLDRIVKAFMKPPKNNNVSTGMSAATASTVKKRKSEGGGEGSAAASKGAAPKRAKKERQTTLTSNRTSTGSSSNRRKSKTTQKRKISDEEGWASGGDESGQDEEKASAKEASRAQRRRSGRRSSGKDVSYAEVSSDEDEQAMEEAEEEEEEEEEGQGDEEQQEESDADAMEVDEEGGRNEDGEEEDGNEKQDADPEAEATGHDADEEEQSKTADKKSKGGSSTTEAPRRRSGRRAAQ